MNDNFQIFESINVGLVILGADYTIAARNRWMEHHSGVPERDVLGKNLFDAFPNLAEPKYRRSFKSVLTFGNHATFRKSSTASSSR